MADTQYIIDVAANMPEAGVTTAKLDELSASLIEAGASAESLEAATISVNAQLIAARSATSAANDALAEGNARYGELERAAVKAAKAVERVSKRGIIDPELSKASHEASAALEAFTPALRELEQGASAAAKAEAKLALSHANLKRLSSSAAGSFSEQAAAARKSVKEAEGFVPLAKQYGDFSDAVSTSSGRAILAAGAFFGVATAIAALTAAALAGTLAIAGMAVSLADAKREAALTEEAAAALHPELGALAGVFANISEETGAGAADLRAWKKQLEGAKVAAEDIPYALRAMAQAEAALGKGGSSEFLENLKETKRSAGEVAREFDDSLGGIVAKRMMGLGAQSEKLKKNFGEIFGGLNIDPVLEGFRILVDLFDKNTAAGEAMKFLFEEIFQPLIDQATNAAYVVEAFVLGFLIGLTKLYISLKPAIKTIKEFFGFEDTALSDTLDIAKAAGELVVPVFLVFAGILGTIAVVIGLAIAQLVAIQVVIYGVIAAVVYAGTQIYQGFLAAWQAVTDYLSNLSLVEIGLMLVRGLAAGITGGASEVVGAILNVAKGAITAAKSALGIASPSKVFADIGGYTAEGFAVGVDDGTAEAHAAMAALVEPPQPGVISPFAGLSGESAPAQGGAAGRAGAGAQVVINGDIYFGGSKATQAEKDELAEALTRLLEGDAAAMAGEGAAA